MQKLDCMPSMPYTVQPCIVKVHLRSSFSASFKKQRRYPVTWDVPPDMKHYPKTELRLSYVLGIQEAVRNSGLQDIQEVVECRIKRGYPELGSTLDRARAAILTTSAGLHNLRASGPSSILQKILRVLNGRQTSESPDLPSDVRVPLFNSNSTFRKGHLLLLQGLRKLKD